jgi:hypothetical protein
MLGLGLKIFLIVLIYLPLQVSMLNDGDKLTSLNIVSLVHKELFYPA